MHPLLFWFPKALPFLKLGETIYDPNFKIKKMSSFQAGLANDWEDKLTKFIKMRSANSRYWKACFQPSPNSQLATDSSNLPASSFQLLANISDIDSFLRFPVSINDRSFRKSILEKSQRKGLGIMHTYPDSINGIQELKEEFNGQNFPVAKILAKNLVTLPVHPLVSEQDMQRIIRLLTQMEHGPST
jgi:dTDP-4-amino-4,6-dideoxygalactose transaminase